uniref:Spectrin alpha chain-like protein n=1 Tax=Anisakis simplex TaxID=6269 RepID=A0A0M3J625_ANISI
LLEADITAHADRVGEMNQQADSLLESGQFDQPEIEERRRAICDRYERIRQLADVRRDKLNKAITVHQFIRDIDDEESWIKEKKLLVSSDDYGRDLTGVQNLRKKHRRLDNELASHEPQMQLVREKGLELLQSSDVGVPEIRQRMTALEEVEEEEAWMNEKQQILSSDNFGENMAGVQGLLKKHDAFEADLALHTQRVNQLIEEGEKLIAAGNHHSPLIKARCDQLKARLNEIGELAKRRLLRLRDNSAYLQFMWKCDVVESWIAEKEQQVRSDDYGRDLSSVQILLTKQEAFDAGLNAFEHEGIQRITELKDQLVNSHHAQTPNIEKRHQNVIARWQQLLANSEARRQKLLKMQEQYKQIEELYLTFAKKVGSFRLIFFVTSFTHVSGEAIEK